MEANPLTSHRSPTLNVLALSCSAFSAASFSACILACSSSLYFPSLFFCRKAFTLSVDVNNNCFIHILYISRFIPPKHTKYPLINNFHRTSSEFFLKVLPKAHYLFFPLSCLARKNNRTDGNCTSLPN